MAASIAWANEGGGGILEPRGIAGHSLASTVESLSLGETRARVFVEGVSYECSRVLKTSAAASLIVWWS